MIGWVLKKILGTQNQREVRRLTPLVGEINRHEEALRPLSFDELRGKTVTFRERLAKGESLDQLLPEAFAVVKNCCRRFTEEKRRIRVRGQEILWEMIPFDVQLIGGMVLHSGRIAEMATGEGKTLVATLPTYLNALSGKGVHVVTVNDYLAARDAEWMGEVYRELGQALPPVGRLGKITEEKVRGHILIVPPSMVRRKGLEVLKNRKVGVVTGWALDRSAIYRYRCDEAFALSDHADYGELIEMVEKVKPKEVRTVHGYAQEFAMDLQERGWKAWALAGETQLVLPLGTEGVG